MIGQAKLHERLYLLQIPEQEAYVNVVDFKDKTCNKDIWHLRLRHLFDKIHQYTAVVHPYICFKENNICDTCNCAK